MSRYTLIKEFDAAIEQKNAIATEVANAPRRGFNPIALAVTQYPVDAQLADGKKQKTFYNRVPLFGAVAATQRQSGILLERRPEESRDFAMEYIP